MRPIYPADVARLEELLGEQNARDGTNYPLPRIFVPDADNPGHVRQNGNVVLGLITEVRGRIEQGHVFLRTLEMMSFGVSRRATAMSIRERAAVFYLLRQKGYADMHVQVPKDRASAMEHSLAQAMGLVRDDDRLAHFYREL